MAQNFEIVAADRALCGCGYVFGAVVRHTCERGVRFWLHVNGTDPELLIPFIRAICPVCGETWVFDEKSVHGLHENA